MIKILEGNYEARGKRFAILASRWNNFIVSKLLMVQWAQKRHNIEEKDVEIIMCPGHWEFHGSSNWPK